MADKSAGADGAKQSSQNQFGSMPEWDLSDLYPGTTSDEFKNDLSKAEKNAEAFEKRFKGCLEDLTKKGQLIEAINAYETLSDLTGRIGSFAYLNYAKNTQDPDRAKFLGDCQEALTNLSSKLIFFSLELNRIDDKILNEALAAKGELSRYKPWFDELRKAKPYQLEDRVEELFHEKSVTGRGAWNRLFDETMASLKFDVKGEQLGL
ncbi:MAG: oligoendopeptidase F, partial [Devosiaceae bacterium]|nr:oligoendopeptidase F [Devosiaceae bacterium]